MHFIQKGTTVEIIEVVINGGSSMLTKKEPISEQLSSCRTEIGVGGGGNATALSHRSEHGIGSGVVRFFFVHRKKQLDRSF